jgi:BirA family transcriptional regulator, biotin operon repressor / biotin---[acetyl-CoA-carboxylase] ligase
MRLTPAHLQIAFRNLTDVQHFFFYPSIGSTNDKAKELAQKGAEEGTLVIADTQTAGRGRLDRHWFSPPGLGIYLSAIVRPKVPAESAFGVHMAAAIALAQAADAQHLQSVVGIKWPNDLVAEGRKLAGILSEVGIQAGILEWCVVGVGINVNHTRTDFPPDLRDRAISLREICNRRLDRLDLVVQFIDTFWLWYDRFLEGGIAVLAPEWRRRSTLLGRTVRVETAGETYVGTALDLENDGALRVRLESGTEEVLHAGDVELVQYR